MGQARRARKSAHTGKMERFAYTIKKFGVVNRYDLSKEFPAITLRKTAIKSMYG